MVFDLIRTKLGLGLGGFGAKVLGTGLDNFRYSTMASDHLTMGELMGVKFGIYTVMHFSANARDVSVKSEGEGKWRALIHIPQ